MTDPITPLRADLLPSWLATCCQCGRVVDTREQEAGGDGHGCQLDDGCWVCSSECWDDNAVKDRTMTDDRHTGSLLQNCTIDLRGAGYLCLLRNEEGMFGVLHEGHKVMLEGDRVVLDGLHILGPVAVAALSETTDEEIMAHPKVKALVEALEWYAEKGHWRRSEIAPRLPCEAVYDAGNRATTALRDLKGGEW